MAERVSAAVARNIVRAKAKKLPFEPAAKMVHVHEACGGRGCEVCDEQGAWLVAIGVDTSPAKPSLTATERAAAWAALPEYVREQKRADSSVQRAAAAAYVLE